MQELPSNFEAKTIWKKNSILNLIRKLVLRIASKLGNNGNL